MKVGTFLLASFLIFLPAQVTAKTNADSLFKNADKSFLQGEYEKTVEYAEELLKEFKTTALKDDANLLAGLALLKLSRFAEARAYFNKLISQKPRSPLTEAGFLGLADSYFLEKNYAEAEVCYGEILTRFPKTELLSIVNLRLEDLKKPGEEFVTKPSAYSVQIGSFADRDNAAKLYYKFKKRGYSAYMFEAVKNGRTAYKIRIGKFKSRKKAENLARDLRKQGYATRVCAW